MGRTLPSAHIVLLQEEAAFGRFKRALRRADQLALDELFTAAKQHTAAAQYASHALPFEVFMLAMLLEEHKQVMRLRDRLNSLLMTGEKAQQPKLDALGSSPRDPGFGFEDDPLNLQGEDHAS